METESVLPYLESSSGKAVRFLVDGEQLVPNDFHVTEVKRLTVEALDCGGGVSAWQELVVQLWSPSGDNTQAAMTAAKFLSILAKANALDHLGGNALRFEYGGVGAPAVQYHCERIDSTGNTVDVHLGPPHVACKPHERARLTELSVLQDEVCCTPSSAGVCCS